MADMADTANVIVRPPIAWALAVLLDCVRPNERDDRRRRLDTRCGHP